MRTVLDRSVRSAAGVELVFVKEAVKNLADWSFTAEEHVLIVHRAGELQALETEFESGLAARTLPSVGDVWAAPGGEKYSAFAKRGVVSYCEVRLGRSGVSRREMAPRIAHRDGFLHALVERAAPLASFDDDLSVLLLASIMETTRLHVAAAYFDLARDTPPRFTLNETRRLRDHIDGHLECRHSAGSLSSQVGMSESEFIAAFSASFGSTPHQYLIERRIDRAKRLLRETRLPLTEIAMRTGFSTPSHFSTAFRARTGIAPRDYRKINR